jgi:hypothetical protein
VCAAGYREVADGRLHLAACRRLHAVVQEAVCRLLAAVVEEARRGVAQLVRTAPREGRVARPRDMAPRWIRTWAAAVPAVLLEGLQIGAALVARAFAGAGCAFEGAGANEDLRADNLAVADQSQRIPTIGVHGSSERREESSCSLGGCLER